MLVGGVAKLKKRTRSLFCIEYEYDDSVWRSNGSESSNKQIDTKKGIYIYIFRNVGDVIISGEKDSCTLPSIPRFLYNESINSKVGV
jgi:hypothetical protein